MADYARLLLAGDRAALAALYDPDGTILVRGGRRIDATMDEIVARYRHRWGPPQSFEWRDLHYEAAGPDAIVVLGKFAWGEGSGPPDIGLYHALLRRHRGQLVIRIEDEGPDPSASTR
ncbi:MAG: nuclear transport factor 2 family protein [Sphingosinicella sp.]